SLAEMGTKNPMGSPCRSITRVSPSPISELARSLNSLTPTDRMADPPVATSVATARDGAPWDRSGSEVVDGDRLDRLIGREVEAEDLRVERQLAVEGPADVRRLPEPVLLPFEGDVGDGDALGPQGRHDHL